MPAQVRGRCRVSAEWAEVARLHSPEVVIVGDLPVFASQPAEMKAARALPADHKRFLMFCSAETPGDTVAATVAGLGVRTSGRLHLARLEADGGIALLRRLLAGCLFVEGEESILDAWWDGDDFVVISPRFRRLRIPAGQLPALSKATRTELRNFEIDEFGDFVHWPSHDVHIGWPGFEQTVDPVARMRAEQKSAAFNRRYGKAIRELREEKGLTQTHIPGLDERTVRRIEQGETRATARALTALAVAHRMEPNAYMNELSDRMPAKDT